MGSHAQFVFLLGLFLKLQKCWVVRDGLWWKTISLFSPCPRWCHLCWQCDWPLFSKLWPLFCSALSFFLFWISEKPTLVCVCCQADPVNTSISAGKSWVILAFSKPVGLWWVFFINTWYCALRSPEICPLVKRIKHLHSLPRSKGLNWKQNIASLYLIH